MIKIGTSSLLRPDLSSINLSSIARICETVKELRTEGLQAYFTLYRPRLAAKAVIRDFSLDKICKDCNPSLLYRAQSCVGFKRGHWSWLPQDGPHRPPLYCCSATGCGRCGSDTPVAILPRLLCCSGSGELPFLCLICSFAVLHYCGQHHFRPASSNDGSYLKKEKSPCMLCMLSHCAHSGNAFMLIKLRQFMTCSKSFRTSLHNYHLRMVLSSDCLQSYCTILLCQAVLKAKPKKILLDCRRAHKGC